MYFSFFLIKKYQKKENKLLLKTCIGVYFVLNVFLAFSKWWINYYAVFSILSLIGLFIVIALDGVWFMYKNKLLAVAMLLNLSAVACYFIDAAKIFYWPDSYLQFHALWHILSAITFFLYFLSIQNNAYEG